MSEDLNDKIKQIADVLGQENASESIKDILSLLSNSASSEDPSQKETDKDFPHDKEKSNEATENMDMIRKLTRLMSSKDTVNDPRITLLQAIKPFLSSRRQNKLNNCVNILRMSRVINLIDDNEKEG